MYQSLIQTLKKILNEKSDDKDKLLKIQTLVDFAGELKDRPTPPPTLITPPIQQQFQPAKNPTAPGALVGVEDIK